MTSAPVGSADPVETGSGAASASSRPSPIELPRQLPSWSWFTVANLVTALAIAVSDWLTPPETVVGMLLVLPIMLASLTDDRREVWLVFGLAVAAFLAAHFFGRGPAFPLWALDRTIAFLSLPAACLVALALQRRRLELEQARREEARSSELNRLLMALLAHDLRAPLAVAMQALDYASLSREGGGADDVLLAEAKGRLRRSLGKVDGILSLARADFSVRGEEAEDGPRPLEALRTDLAGELAAFRPEAEARGTVLEFEVVARPGWITRGDALVLRQSVAILVDNAIRHAAPGRVRVTGDLSDSEARLLVEDGGPSGEEPDGEDAGSGLGLLLCRTLLERAGGSLDVAPAVDSGTRCAIRLPLANATPPEDRDDSGRGDSLD